MDWHSSKLTRRSLLRRLGAGAVVVAAGATLFNEKVALAASPATAAASVDAVAQQQGRPDRSGTLIVGLAPGATIAQINAKFGTRTVMTFTGLNQVLRLLPARPPDPGPDEADKKLVAWVELNARVKTPRKRKLPNGQVLGGRSPTPSASAPTRTPAPRKTPAPRAAAGRR